MWEYTDEVMDHYRNPRNVGRIENATVTGEAGSLSCGDMLKIYLNIDNNIVTDAKFQTFGCGSAVASSSILTEMVKGKSIEEVKKITNKDIADKLGGLPPAKMHCSVMGKEALDDALKKLAVKNSNSEEYDNANKTEENKIICNCFQISEKEIEKEVSGSCLKSVQQVSDRILAGSGCGRCKDQIKNIVDRINNEKGEEFLEVNPPLTNTQKILKINNVLEKIVSVQLSKDGGDIELIDVNENIVKVRLKGSCKGCKNSLSTLKNYVEIILKENVSKDIEVIEE